MPGRRILVYVLAGSIGLFSCNGSADVSETILRITPELIDVASGGTATIAYRIRNPSDTPVRVEGNLQRPEVLTLAIPPEPVGLPSKGSATMFAMIRATSRTPPGTYNVIFHLRDAHTAGTLIAEKTRIRVMAVPKLEIRPLAIPQRLIANSKTVATYMVSNVGNTVVRARLQARLSSNTASAPKLDADLIDLKPGETREVAATFTTAADRGFQRTERLVVTATGLSTDDSSLPLAQSASVIDVLPEVGGSDPWIRLPITASTAVTETESRTTFNSAINGSGYIDENSERRLEFEVNGSGDRSANDTDQSVQATAQYEQDQWRLAAGNRSFDLSELTSVGRNGVGASVAYGGDRIGPLWGVYGVEDEAAVGERFDLAGHFGWRTHREDVLKLNFLHYSGVSSDVAKESSETVTSLQIDPANRPWGDLAIEIAQNMQDSGSAWQAAYGTDIREQGPRLTLFARQAAPTFAGRLPDSASWGTSLEFRRREGVNITGRYEEYRRNLDSIVDRGAAVRESNTALTARLPVNELFGLRGGVRRLTYRDAVSPSDAAYERLSGEVGINLRLEKWRHGLSVKQERRDDVGSPDKRAEQGYSIFSRWQPSPSFSATIDFDLVSTSAPEESRLGNDFQQRRLNLRWLPVDELAVALSYANNKKVYDDLALREREATQIAAATATWRLNNRNRIYFKAAQIQDIELETRNQLTLSYEHRFSLPVKRRSGIGSLRGRLVDTTRDQDNGVSGAIIFADTISAVTDANGFYRFRGLPAGPHRLRVETDRIVENLIPATPAGHQVTVQPGINNEYDLSLVAGSELVGSVRYAESGQPLGGILVELRREEEVHRTLSSAQGEYRFERLEPGEWQLKVYGQNLPDGHRLQNAEQVIFLQSGYQMTPPIEVTKPERKLQMIQWEE